MDAHGLGWVGGVSLFVKSVGRGAVFLFPSFLHKPTRLNQSR